MQPQALPGITAAAVAKRGNEVYFWNEGPAILAHDDENLAAIARDLRCASRAREAHFRVFVATDDGGVDVGEAVYLRATEESNGNTAPLQPVREHFRNRDSRQRGLTQLWITDGEGKHFRLRRNRPGFVDEGDIRSVSEARKVAGSRGCADAHETHIGIAQGT